MPVPSLLNLIQSWDISRPKYYDNSPSVRPEVAPHAYWEWKFISQFYMNWQQRKNYQQSISTTQISLSPRNPTTSYKHCRCQNLDAPSFWERATVRLTQCQRKVLEAFLGLWMCLYSFHGGKFVIYPYTNQITLIPSSFVILLEVDLKWLAESKTSREYISCVTFLSSKQSAHSEPKGKLCIKLIALVLLNLNSARNQKSDLGDVYGTASSWNPPHAFISPLHPLIWSVIFFLRRRGFLRAEWNGIPLLYAKWQLQLIQQHSSFKPSTSSHPPISWRDSTPALKPRPQATNIKSIINHQPENYRSPARNGSHKLLSSQLRKL